MDPMSNLAPLLERNQAFARTDARENMPPLPFIPRLNLYIVTCIDCRVDPAEILGVRLGEALVQRNIGGRITPAVLQDIAYASYLVETKAPEGPYFEVAIIHHTDCGSTLLADDNLRHGFAPAGRHRRKDPRGHAGPGSCPHGPDRRGAGAVGRPDPARRPGIRSRLCRRDGPGDHRRRGRIEEVGRR